MTTVSKYKKGFPQRRRDKRSRKNLEAIRLTAVKRVLAGEKPGKVIKELGFHRSCIYEWLRIYKQQGEEGLHTTAKAVHAKEASLKEIRLPDKTSTAHAIAEKIPSPIPDNLQQWILILYQSLLNSQRPMNAFLQKLNLSMPKAYSVIAADLYRPYNYIRGTPKDYELTQENVNELIIYNRLISENWLHNPLLKQMNKPGDIKTIDEVIQRDQWVNNDYCRNVLLTREQQSEDVLGFCFAGPENALFGLFIFGLSKYFTPELKSFLHLLRPYLETAMGIAVQQMRYSFTVKALDEATDSLDIATIVLDGNGTVVKVNATAYRLLQEKDFIAHLKRRQIYFTNAGNRARFEQAVNKAIAWRQAPIGNKPIDALRFDNPKSRTERNTIGVLIQPITPPSHIMLRSEAVYPHVIIYLSEPSKSRLHPKDQLIAQLFGLSNREAHLTTLLTKGHTILEAAEQMNITEATARTYLQHIYDKVGVNRRQDLVQRVLKSVALLA